MYSSDIPGNKEVAIAGHLCTRKLQCSKYRCHVTIAKQLSQISQGILMMILVF